MADAGRALGVDFGTKRIGLATCNAGRTLASPLAVLQRTGDRMQEHRAIVHTAQEEEAVVIVVGMPTDLQGQAGQAAQTIAAEVEELRLASPLPVEVYDERMTTAAAAKNLQAQGVSAKQRRESIDKYAAAVMLQGWLDAHDRNEETP